MHVRDSKASLRWIDAKSAAGGAPCLFAKLELTYVGGVQWLDFGLIFGLDEVFISTRLKVHCTKSDVFLWLFIDGKWFRF